MAIPGIIHRWFRVPYRLSIEQMSRVKKPQATIVFIHGIGNSGKAWEEVIAKLPATVNTITIDLLGFGASPRPKEAKYDATIQARSVFLTLILKRWRGPLIVVGHSMGALVGVELALRHPKLVQRLILCSPPFYVPDPLKRRLMPSPDKMRRELYKALSQRPDQFVKVAALAMKYTLVNKSFNVTTENVDSYMAALNGMIINQDSFEEAVKLKVPTHIIRGTFDPLIVVSNLKQLTKVNPHITMSTVIASHEVRGAFIPELLKQIKQ